MSSSLIKSRAKDKFCFWKQKITFQKQLNYLRTQVMFSKAIVPGGCPPLDGSRLREFSRLLQYYGFLFKM